MEKKLFITDLDLTALGGYEPYNRLPKNFCKFLDDLVANGWDWATNTTWDTKGQWEMIQNSPVKSAPRFLCGENGRSMDEIVDQKLVNVEPFTTISEQKLLDFRTQRLYPMIKEVIKNWMPFRCYDYGHLFHFLINSCSDFQDILNWATPYLDDPEIEVKVTPKELTLHPRYLTKGVQMQILCDIYNYAPKNIVAAGDNIPDLDMMCEQFCAHPIAPANAKDEVKQYVLAHGGAVGSSDYSDGVIEAFKIIQGK